MKKQVILRVSAILTLISFFIVSSSLRSYAQANPKGIKVIVTQSPKIIVNTLHVTHNQCFGESKGAINIGVSGGYPPYKYYWSHGDTTQDVAALRAGIYKVAVYDEFSCSDTLRIEVKEPKELQVKIAEIKPILCYGYNHGAIDISVSGGTPPYSFRWNNGAQTEDLMGITSGRYSTLITDANGCQEIIMAEVEEKSLIIRSLENMNNIMCHNDSTGSIDISVSGGVPPYTYLWNNGETTEDLYDLRSGVYEVIVKDSEGCTEVSTTKVIEPDRLTITLDQVQHLRCSGDFGGAINIRVQGGRQPYFYSWNNGAETQDIAGIQAGQYTVNIKDKNGCSASLQVEVSQPEPLNAVLAASRNVLFHGGENGAIDIDVTGGVAPYEYKWDNGSQEQDISGLKAGSYSVRITDAIGCTKMMNLTITQPAPLVVKVDGLTHISCNGSNTGQINISVYGGITPYTYKWSNGANTQDISGLFAGKYSVTITDANGFKITTDTILAEPPAFTAEIVKTTAILCYGQHSGAVDVQVSGGVKPYRYYWNNGHKGQDLKDVPAGKYNVKIIDSNHCEQILAVEITEPEQLTLTFDAISQIKCYNNKDGAISVSTSGGFPPYTFKWNNGAHTEDITGLSAGDYNLIVSDAHGCTQQIATAITQPDSLAVKETLINNVDCHGNKSGTINLSVSGGMPPYTYSWSNGSKTKDIAHLGAGNYRFTVTDANGCETSYHRTITEPARLMRKLEKITPIACFDQARGAIDISVSGGVAPYYYEWSNGAVAQDVVSVKAGKYSVMIVDANGCTDSLNATVTQNPLLTASITVKHIQCNGQHSGALTLAVEGGVMPYSYQWSNGETTKDISALAAGNYAVTVTDAAGCRKTLDAQVTAPSKFRVSLASEKHILCYGKKEGGINIRVSGGVKPYSFRWSNGDTTKNLMKIAAGEYKLYAEDANGCTQAVTARISQPSKIEYGIKNIRNVSCFDDPSGAIDIIVSGGLGPYTYEWSNGVTTQDISGVKAGGYSVRITDANGCERMLKCEITQPSALEVSTVSLTHIYKYGQNNGAIDIAVKGGVQPYIYSWSNGATTEDISAVAGGSYSVNVRDANSCEKTLYVVINQPPPLVVELIEVNDISCRGDKTGSINISVEGGKPPYKFKWTNGDSSRNITQLAAGNYSVMVTDANGNSETLKTTIAQPAPLMLHLDAAQNLLCYSDQTGAINVTASGGIRPYTYLWNTGATNEDLSGLQAGTYTLTVTDRNNCTSSLTTAITQPESFEVQLAEIKHIRCNGNAGGAIHLDIKGGAKPYSYSWNNGERTKDLTGIPAGDYSVEITDANGCSRTLSTALTEPSELIVEIAKVNNNVCQGEEQGTITLMVKGGVPPFIYNWSNGATTQNLQGLSSGQYTATITDANGCEKKVTAIISEPSLLYAEIHEVINVNCHGQSTGEIYIDVSGGVQPYIYSWNTGATEKNLQNLSAGMYQLMVTDKNGCSRRLEATVAEPNPLTATLDTIGHVLCNGDSEGFLEINVHGGKPPYSYNWNNGAHTEDLENLPAGEYTLNVEDANGCSHTLNASIKQPVPLTIQLSAYENVKCWGDHTGALRISASGGVGPYRYQWSNGETSDHLVNVPAGYYKATVTDANGCVKVFEKTVTQPRKLIASIDAITNIRCNGDTSGSISVSVREGEGPYTFRWNNGATTEDLRQVSAGDYALTITEANGCETVLRATVEEPEPFITAIDKTTHVKCYSDSTGAIDVRASGGVKPYIFSWSNGSQGEDLVDIRADSYSVMITDGNGCIKTLYAEITEPPALSLQIDSVKNVKCCGDDNGAIYISVGGGVKPYQYQWSNGATTEDITKLVLGEYTVEVTDANNCSISSLDEMNLYEQVVTTGKFISRDILFDVAKSTIKAESFTAVNKIATFMKEHPEISFRIDGHTDSDGSYELNQKLSEERAAAVKAALIKFGIWESRLTTSGFGESSPIASNATDEGKALNRRVEFILLTGTMEGLLVE